MPDKHRGAVDFRYPEGAFASMSTAEALQLYRVFECEVTAGKSAILDISDCSDVLLFCFAGEGAVCVDDREYPFSQEAMLYCPSSISTITLTSSSSFAQYMVVVFDTSFQANETDVLPLVRFFQSVDAVQYTESAPECRRLFSVFLAELSLLSPTMMLVKGYFYQLMVGVYRCLSCNATTEGARTAAVNAVGQTVYAIIRYIDLHLFTLNNLTDMAKELGYSYNYLSHLFRRKTGITIQAYVMQKKIERSLSLLEDERYSVTEIASMLNYDCIQSFSKTFRRAMQMSPTEYRARHLRNL